MSKLNWEKANSRQRYFKSLFSSAREYEASAPRQDKFDLNSALQNPLGLTDEDCRGRIPEVSKRKAIVRQLLRNNRDLNERYGDKWDVDNPNFEISSKSFREFSWKIFLHSLDASPEDWPEGSSFAYAVCLSIIYLEAYNSTFPSKRLGALTPEALYEIEKYNRSNKVNLNGIFGA